jgi:hypothetical protein
MDTVNNAVDVILTPAVAVESPKRGMRLNTSNYHAKNDSGIAQAFKRAGLNWREAFAKDIMANNKKRIAMWMRLLPYLVITQGHKKIKKSKGKASRAALIALETLEGR